MKKKVTIAAIIFLVSIIPAQQTAAQIAIVEIIKAGVKKIIIAVDLKIQRLQNETIWLQNAQKTLENEMSKIKLDEISNWAKQQKELYSKYFDQLWKVRSAIGTYQAVRDIINKQTQLVREYSTAFNLVKQDKNFSPEEIDYIQQVFAGILEESLKSIEQVQFAITSFLTQMTDAKRLTILHTAADNIEQTLTDLRQFNQQNIGISLQRSKERNDIDVTKKLYGIEQ